MTRTIWTARRYFPDLLIRMAAAGISQRALAQQLGHRSPSLFNAWCTGRKGARAESIEAVEIAFGQLTGAGGPRDD